MAIFQYVAHRADSQGAQAMIMIRTDPVKRALLKLLDLSALVGCTKVQGEGRSVSAVVINYTDRYIADVSVNEQWAGSANTYGGEGNRVEGFVAPRDPNKQVLLRVKWSVGSYYSIESNAYTRAPIEQHSANIELPLPHPLNASYFVLHFYPDGHVEAELTSDRPNRRISKPVGYRR